MASWLSGLPKLQDFFPPTPAAANLVATVFKSIPIFSLASWTPLRRFQAMGKTSSDSKLNLPGRYAWCVAENVGPLNLIYILYTLPKHLRPEPYAPTSLLGTGLPVQFEFLGVLYVIHYINRATVTPLFLAPSMSPIHPSISVMMASFQFMNSTNIANWIVRSAHTQMLAGQLAPILSVPALTGLSLYVLGLLGNIASENTLFSLRRGAARRKARSEGKAQITYDKVYVIPPPQGWFAYILHPHYTLEWIEWTGYWILGGAWGLGYSWANSAALWFLINELVTMLPRAYEGKGWYAERFGDNAVAGRKAAIPGVL